MNALYLALASAALAGAAAAVLAFVLPALQQSEVSAHAYGLAQALAQGQAWSGRLPVQASPAVLYIREDWTLAPEPPGAPVGALLVGECAGAGLPQRRIPADGSVIALGRACYLVTPRLVGNTLYVYSAYGEVSHRWQAAAYAAGRWTIHGRELEVYVIEARPG